MKDVRVQNWTALVYNNSMCTNYRIIKFDCGVDKYIKILSEDARIPLTKFRCGNHRLPISTSRFSDHKSNVCLLCNTGEVGDEYHYILMCPNLALERKQLVKRYYYNKPNTVKFFQLFN